MMTFRAVLGISLLCLLGVVESKLRADDVPCVADIGLVLDTSYSVSGKDGSHEAAKWKTEKEFVKKLAEAFKVSEETVHMSVETFSRTAKINIRFDQFYKPQEIADHMDTVGIKGRTTRLDKALIEVEGNMFSKENGARKKEMVPRVLIILTDGAQTYDQPEGMDPAAIDPRPFAKRLRDQGVKIIVVGVPDMKGHLEKDHLKGLGNEYDYYTVAEAFQTLLGQDFIKTIVSTECGEFVAPDECDQVRADIGWAVDSSYSVGGWDGTGEDGKGWRSEKTFIREFAKAYKMSSEGIRMSTLDFSETADMVIDFKDHFNSGDFMKALEKMPYQGSITRIDLAMRVAKDQMFTKARGKRDGVPCTLILLTDGTQTYRRQVRSEVEPTQYAKQLRDTGCQIIAIGVPDKYGRISQTELEGLTGDSALTFTRDTFEEIFDNGFMFQIAKISCKKSKK